MPAFRGRRARPTSAKALKHRRVVDDSVDSIIYEDDEEEQEEEEVAQVVTEAASQGSLTSGQDTRYGDTGEALGETISESFETTCDSVDSVDCASKMSEVHVRDVEALTMQDIGIHRPTTPMCSMVSMAPVRGAPQLCLNLSPSTSSSNAQGQLGQIGQADPDREMRTLAFHWHSMCLHFSGRYMKIRCPEHALASFELDSARWLDSETWLRWNIQKIFGSYSAFLCISALFCQVNSQRWRCRPGQQKSTHGRLKCATVWIVGKNGWKLENSQLVIIYFILYLIYYILYINIDLTLVTKRGLQTASG